MRRGISKRALMGLLAVLAVGVAGCNSDKPHEYGRQRPPVDQLDSRDRGLQSKDVVESSEAMTMDILSNVPELNASPTQWTIVVDRVENITGDRRQDFNIFLQRLKVRLAQRGHGRISLIANKAELAGLQARELDRPSQDEFGQGGGGGARSTRLQPDFALNAKMMEMPNRATSYFMCEFSLVALRNTPQYREGQIVWTNMYEVKTER